MPDRSLRLPPFVYLPVDRPTDELSELEPQSRPLDAGGTGLVLYTALDRLHRAWGLDQGWVVMSLDHLSALQQRLGFDAFLPDDGLDESERAHV